MSEHKARLVWKLETDSFAYADYNREHDWIFENGQQLRAAAAPTFLGSADCVDPEEAFVAALSSCHMLTFLAICANKNLVVTSYQDDPVGHLEKDEKGRLIIKRVVLHPTITFRTGQEPDEKQLKRLHGQSHRQCFLANSVITEITVAGME